MYKFLVCAIIAASCCAPVCADINAFGLDASRWGRTGASIGVQGMTIEDFEDVSLTKGLQVLWSAPNGSVGPTSTLPNLFNPNTDDPFGTAFAGGAWTGAHALLNTRTNRPFPYPESGSWGTVEFQFNPPVTTVAFSVQQMDINNPVIINGVNRGPIGTLVGLPVNGARMGYVVFNATGADTISTLRIASTGDGFVLDHLAFTTEPVPRLTMSLVPSALWGSPDASLGFATATVEDFEDVSLAPGLSVGVESPLGDRAPSPTLPAVFDPIADDPFGNAFEQGVWDGTHALLNTRDNLPHTYAEVGSWGDTTLRFDPPVSHVGFAMGDNDLPTHLTLNGRLVALLDVPHGPRQGFLRFAAPSRFATFTILNGRTPFGDGLVIDHVAFMNCRVDLNADSIVNSADFFDFLTLFFAGSPGADFNLDKSINSQDFFDFLSAFFLGC